MDDNLINGLKSKIGQIISRYESLKSENTQINAELSKCKQQLQDKNEQITELKKQIDNLQLTEAFRSSYEDTKEAKQKIAKLIREIDKCITMLND